MARSAYTPEFKLKLVLQLHLGEKDVNTLATENKLNPGQIHTWEKEFLEGCSRTFEGTKQAKETRSA